MSFWQQFVLPNGKLWMLITISIVRKAVTMHNLLHIPSMVRAVAVRGWLCQPHQIIQLLFPNNLCLEQLRLRAIR